MISSLILAIVGFVLGYNLTPWLVRKFLARKDEP